MTPQSAAAVHKNCFLILRSYYCAPTYTTTRPGTSLLIISCHFLFGGVSGAGPSEVPGNRSSKFISLGTDTGVARVVVNPIQRPRKMILIHRTSDTAAVALPPGGAEESACH